MVMQPPHPAPPAPLILSPLRLLLWTLPLLLCPVAQQEQQCSLQQWLHWRT
jgi:hypothetical protein